MGSRGGNSPNPYPQRSASTLFLRVPYGDWPRVAIGEKTEFRARPPDKIKVLGIKHPTPIVAYATNGRDYRGQLMVLEEHRYEPLFAIAEDKDGLAREGFESYDAFRRYWRARRKGVYRPLEMVHVFRLRAWTAQDHVRFGVRLLGHLYGDWLPPISPLRHDNGDQ